MTIPTKPILVFVDDDEDFSNDVESALEPGKIRFHSVHPTQLALFLKEKIPAHIFLVDYRLNQKPHEGEKFPWTGQAVAGMLRGKFPEHPIYMISRMLSSATARSPGWEWFDRVLTVEQLAQGHGSILYDDARDYAKLREVRRGSRPEFFKLLRVPKQVDESLLNCLPASLRRGVPTMKGDASVPQAQAFDREGAGFAGWWVRTVMLHNSGPLFDDLRAATAVGCTPQVFNRLVDDDSVPRSAQYRGVFAASTERRWWKQLLEGHVLSQAARRGISGSEPWLLGPKVFELRPNQQTHCVVCGEPGPELVARDFDDPSERASVHAACSEPDDRFSPLPFFEPSRGFRLE